MSNAWHNKKREKHLTSIELVTTAPTRNTMKSNDSANVEKNQLDSESTSLSADELRRMDAYWRACNYLCVGMLYLQANPLLREPLRAEHIKNRLLGHWGSDPGQTFTWVHLNRLTTKYDLDAIYISGPAHGAPATLSNSYLEGVYSEVYPDKSQDVEGMQKFFRQFSFPGGIGSHCTPETPGNENWRKN